MMKPEQEDDYEELLLSLPKVRNWAGTYLYQYQGVWCEPRLFQSLLLFLKHFEARDTDIVVATLPKSGTTWLKALTFSIKNRTLHSPLMINSPLLSSNPHALVPFLEVEFFNNVKKPAPFIRDLPSPRILATHVPCRMLPASVHDSKCRIIYLCRNPLDQFISHYLYFQKITTFRPAEAGATVELKEAFDAYFEGAQLMGPTWDHVLGYWEASIERPDKVLFLRFEDLKEDTLGWIKKMAEFLGCPFSEEEEEAGGVIRDIVKLCSFDTLNKFEVNETGELFPGLKNKWFFRKGEVGDWANYLTPEMVERAQAIVEEKLRGSGLTFDFHLNKV